MSDFKKSDHAHPKKFTTTSGKNQKHAHHFHSPTVRQQLEDLRQTSHNIEAILQQMLKSMERTQVSLQQPPCEQLQQDGKWIAPSYHQHSDISQQIFSSNHSEIAARYQAIIFPKNNESELSKPESAMPTLVFPVQTKESEFSAQPPSLKLANQSEVRKLQKKKTKVNKKKMSPARSLEKIFKKFTGKQDAGEISSIGNSDSEETGTSATNQEQRPETSTITKSESNSNMDKQVNKE